MIAFEPDHLREIILAAQAAYPAEACGLLVGRRDGLERWRVVRVAPSPNLAGDPTRNFEIDSKLRLDLQRDLRDGADQVIGFYHSHPDAPAQPSAADLQRAWEPDLVWVIVSVIGGVAVLTSAHVLVEEAGRSRFEEVAIHTADWVSAASRPSGEGPGARLRDAERGR